MWTPNDFYVSRDFFNRELINFQVGFVLRADSLWLDPLNKNTLLVTFSVSEQRYTRTTGTITLYISCVLKKRTAVDARLHNQQRFLIQYVQIFFIRHLNPIRTNHCAQVSAISTYHSERCLDYLWPGVGLLAITFLDTSSILSADLTSYELSHLAAVAIGREWVALHVSRQSTDGTHGIHTFIIQQCRSSFYVKIDFEGHQHDTERTQIKVEL